MTAKKFYKNAYVYLSAGVIIVLLGFSQSYFLRLSSTPFPYHLHGISATLWILLLVIQPWLYQKGHLKLHRRIGWISAPLVALIIVGGLIMMRLMIQNKANYPPETVYMLGFIDAVTLLGFGTLYILAIRFRKNIHLHSRFMVATIFGPLIPALTRVFFVLGLAGSFVTSLTFSYLVVELVLLVLCVKERKDLSVRVTYLPLLAYFFFQHIAMYYVQDWLWWISLMDRFAE